jgi:hypothetical protein
MPAPFKSRRHFYLKLRTVPQRLNRTGNEN